MEWVVICGVDGLKLGLLHIFGYLENFTISDSEDARSIVRLGTTMLFVVILLLVACDFTSLWSNRLEFEFSDLWFFSVFWSRGPTVCRRFELGPEFCLCSVSKTISLQSIRKSLKSKNRHWNRPVWISSQITFIFSRLALQLLFLGVREASIVLL